MSAARKPKAKAGPLPRHGAFYISVGAGLAAFGICLLLAPVLAVGIGANAMFITYLGLVAVEFRALTPEFLRQRAADADSPAGALFIVTGLVVAVAVGFLFLALNDGDTGNLFEIAVSVVSVILGWFTVHTMAALHYAYEYYQDAATGPKGKVVGGLNFPDGDHPDGPAFLYFAYVLGMTAQVADVAVTSPAMRRLVTIHGVFSFFFNTVIVAATVNVVVALAGS